jgi:hypothetical protein
MLILITLLIFLEHLMLLDSTTLGGYVDINNSVDISTDLNVVGVTTLATVDINAGEIDVTRIETGNLNVTGIATIASVSIVGAALSSLVVSGISTLAIVDINGGDIEVSNVDTVDLNVTGISTLGTVRISSGIITATSGIVTYYGDGNYLDLTNNPSTGIGIGTTGGLVGYAVTFIDFKGAGVSTTQYNSSTGIATIFFEGGGGGGGSISISTTAPVSPGSGDLWYSPDYGRTFIYYDESVVGYGTDAFWVDAAPFNVGIITALTNVSFSPGSALAPSMFFIGDNQTGFFSPGTGQFTVVSSGSSVLNVNTSGINITGIATITNASGTVKIGIGTTALLVEGNARVTGILTVGSSSITLNGITDTINVGTGLTLSSSGIVAGIITATSFVGDGSNLTGVGVGTEDSINTTGNISAGIATFTRLDVPPIPITFSPGIGVTNQNLDTNIIITFNQQVTKGTGNITLRENSAGGTAFSTIGVSSSSVTISGGAVTIDPPENIGSGVTTFVVVDAGAFSGITTTSVNALINTYNFTALDFTLSSINPANGATNVGVGTNITLTFTGTPVRGTGTIQLRSGSTSGTVIESFDAASSGQISISGNDYIIDPTSNLGFSTSIHTIIPSTAISNYVGLNTTGADTHSFTTVALNLGESYEGGFLICKASPLRWVVSPSSAEVSRTWYLRNDANTRAQQVSGCTGWFVPNCSQICNPAYICRTYWDSFASTRYWSDDACLTDCGWPMPFAGPRAGLMGHDNGAEEAKTFTLCVRSFRCVTY